MEPEALKIWLVDRLTGPRGRADWTELVRAGTDALLDAPFDEVVPEDAVKEVVRAWFTPERLTEVVRPGARLILPLVLAETREDRSPLERWIPPPTRERIARLAARGGWIAPEWITAVFAEKAMEELVADTLYGALRDFSTLVPRIVQSVMPSPLGKLAKLGGKATGGVGGRVFDEVERRLEGEIKRFLEKGTRRALDGATRFSIEHIDDPPASEARAELARFAMAQPPAFHTKALTDEVARELDAIAIEIADAVARSEETGAIIDRTAARVRERFSGKTVREALAESGIEEAPPYGAWADVTWPVVARLLGAPGIDAWLTSLCEELSGISGATG